MYGEGLTTCQRLPFDDRPNLDLGAWRRNCQELSHQGQLVTSGDYGQSQTSNGGLMEVLSM